MHISPRILRAEADALDPNPPQLTARQQAREAKILATATMLLARHGPHTIKFRALALALRISPSTLQTHFIDMDDLLGAILKRHLAALAAIIDAVPHNAPNRSALQRAAWANAIHEGEQLTGAHVLLTNFRHLLPEDLRLPIEAELRRLGETMAGTLAEPALHLLSLPNFSMPRIEAALQTLANSRPPVAQAPPLMRAA
jgi:AcrR family transcriptional regulator